MADNFFNSIFYWLAHAQNPSSVTTPLKCDADGNLKVAGISSSSDSSYWYMMTNTGLNGASTGAVYSRAHSIRQFVATNVGTANAYFMLFTNYTGGTINDGAFDYSFCYPVSPGQTIGMDFPRPFVTTSGVAWRSSSTKNTLTLGDANHNLRVAIEFADAFTV